MTAASDPTGDETLGRSGRGTARPHTLSAMAKGTGAPLKDVEDDPVASSTVPERATGGWRDRVVDRSLAPAADKALRRGQQLLSAAGKLILQSGGDDFTVQQVASKAGLSLRAFYQHFEGKDDLLIALAEETNVVLADLLTYHAEKFDDPLDQLGNVIYYMVDERQHTPSSYNAASARIATRTSISAPSEIARARRPFAELMSRMIERVVESEGLQPLDSERAAFALLALLTNYSRAMYVGNDLTRELPTHGEYVRFCVSGLGATPPIGWEQKFELTDEEAEESRHHSEHVVASFMRTGQPRRT